MTKTTPVPPTKIERIKLVIDHVWPTYRWDLDVQDYQNESVHMTIRSQDKMTVYARVDFTPKHNAPGYHVTVTYPGFNGSAEDLMENAAVIATLVPFLKETLKANVIKGE